MSSRSRPVWSWDPTCSRPIWAPAAWAKHIAPRTRALHRTVAFKVLLRQSADIPGLRQRLEREAKVILSLNHPHICTLFDIGRQAAMCFVMSLSIPEFSRKSAPMPGSDAISLKIQGT